MRARILLASLCVALVAAIAWLSQAGPKDEKLKSWEKVAGRVFRTKESPYSYALVYGEKAEKAILIDATVPPKAVKELGVETIEAVLLTHHHRDTAAFAAEYRKAGVPVRASKDGADWLTPEGVA